MSQVVKIIDYHRNGVCGLGFYVGIVEEVEDGKRREMLVIRFPQKADDEIGNVICAAFDLAQLDKREVRFFHNSWRGDHYHAAIDAAIAEKENQSCEAREAFRLTETPGFNRSRFFSKAGEK